MLLGMVLAAQSGEDSIYSMDQRKFLPASVRDDIVFGQESKPPRFYTPVHGYDRTEAVEQDFWNIDSVFHGWTSGNMVSTPIAVARYTYALFNNDSDMLPQWMIKLMTTTVQEKYGLGVQLNRGSGLTGQPGDVGELWGHTGSRWGYDSFLEYSPKFEFALTGASNVESVYHDQTTQALCFAYNRLAAFYMGVAEPVCQVEGKGCKCSELKPPTLPTTTGPAMAPESMPVGTTGQGDSCDCASQSGGSVGSVPQTELGCHVSPFTGRRVCYVDSACTQGEVSARYAPAKFVPC